MLRKYLIVSLLIAQVVLIAVLISVFLQRPGAASASNVSAPPSSSADAPQALPDTPQTLPGVPGYMWNYSAKFICGYQPPIIATTGLSETVVKPGNYATDINIHNYNYKQITIGKKFLVLVQGNQVWREPQQVGPRNWITLTLGQDMATMDDCNSLWTTSFPAGQQPPSPMPLLTGYLVILSPLDLDIDVAYTAEVPGDLAAPGVGIAENVVRVLGKRVYVPAFP